MPPIVEQFAKPPVIEERDMWRGKAFGILRIVFGLIWAIDAQFKWRPAFQTSFVSYLTGALDGQPALVKAWIRFWIDIVKVDPHFFALIVMGAETALAVALILGVLSNIADLGGVMLAFVIWSTAEGFGGPYKAGSTDIGASIIYVLMFVSLFLSQSGLHFGLDRRLTPMLGRWGWLASGPPGRRIPPAGEEAYPSLDPLARNS
jgi:thiosulfate dehydrogenase (quinone) large subunit